MSLKRENAEKVKKVILNDTRKTKIKIKEVLEDGEKYLLIDGSVVYKEEILEIIEE